MTTFTSTDSLDLGHTLWVLQEVVKCQKSEEGLNDYIMSHAQVALEEIDRISNTMKAYLREERDRMAKDTMPPKPSKKPVPPALPVEEHVLSQGYPDGSGPKWIVTVHNPPIDGTSVSVSDGTNWTVDFTADEWNNVDSFVEENIVYPNSDPEFRR